MANVYIKTQTTKFSNHFFSGMTDFLHDTFSIKLLKVTTELTKRSAMPKKGTYATGLGIIHSTLNKIERHENNFPPDRQWIAIKYLHEHFGINKQWWDRPANADIIFDWEPEAKRISQQGKISIPIKDFTYYQELEAQLLACKQEVAMLKGDISHAAEHDQAYTTLHTPNQDTNPDKTPKKDT